MIWCDEDNDEKDLAEMNAVFAVVMRTGRVG